MKNFEPGQGPKSKLEDPWAVYNFSFFDRVYMISSKLQIWYLGEGLNFRLLLSFYL